MGGGEGERFNSVIGPLAHMDKFLSGATRLFLLLAVVAVVALLFALPTIGPLLFTDVLPERFRFENLPLWLQIPIGCLMGLYGILEIWVFWKQAVGTKSDDPKT